MTSDANAGSQWERVAAELRACREAQQRAWGDIDNTTLGRYLADEVTSEERQQIDGALDELPELRKLTELVRDVLGEFDVTVGEPAVVSYGPAFLPFPQSPARAEGIGRPRALNVQSPKINPPQNWKQRTTSGRYRQRAGLIVAAGLLLALGVTLPGMGNSPSSQPESSLALSQPVAFRGDLTSLVVMADGKQALSEMAKDRRQINAPEPENQLAGISASVQSLKAEGKKAEAETLARHYTNNLTRRALFFREKGDLARAEPALNQAQELCAQTLGFEAPETVRSRNSLANVYAVALNSSPPSNPLLAAPLANPTAVTDDLPPPRSAMRGVATPAPAPAPARVVENAPASESATPAVRHSSSAYGPGQNASKKHFPPTSFAQRGKHAMAYSYGLSPAQPPRPAEQTAMIALRERIIHQSQSELRTSVVPVLTQALRETKDPAERQRLARALGQLGPAARQSVPDLLACYHQATTNRERSAILLTLGQIGPAARQALPVLLDSLHNANREIRQSAARALVQLGPEGRIGIDDTCDCFSLQTIQKEQGEIRRLAANHHIEILVETVASQGLESVGKAGDRKAALGRSCVYLRIDKDAGNVQVQVSDALRKQGLTDTQLRQVLEPYVKTKDYDQGLRASVHFVAQFEKDHSHK